MSLINRFAKQRCSVGYQHLGHDKYCTRTRTRMCVHTHTHTHESAQVCLIKPSHPCPPNKCLVYSALTVMCTWSMLVQLKFPGPAEDNITEARRTPTWMKLKKSTPSSFQYPQYPGILRLLSRGNGIGIGSMTGPGG